MIILNKDKNYKEVWCILYVCGLYVLDIVDKIIMEGLRSKEIVLLLRVVVVYKIIINCEISLFLVFNFLLFLIKINFLVYVNGYFVVNFVWIGIWD